MGEYERIQEAADFIRDRCHVIPEVGVVLGSGLGDFAAAVSEKTVLDYAAIPHFKKVNVVGHAGRLILGKINGIAVVVLQGRQHYYEGYEFSDLVFPVRVLSFLGAVKILLTNAVGAINSSLKPGDLMIIHDHINLMNGNPLRGENDERLGPRFPDMSVVYDPLFQEVIAAALAEIGLAVHKGVYVGVSGPAYETPAEVRMLAVLGADAVGMSTVHEAIGARHLGLRVAGISCITNLAAGLSAQPLSHQEVTATAARVQDDFIRLLKLVIPRMK
jgi:purine-nucleoside phosphorylase